MRIYAVSSQGQRLRLGKLDEGKHTTDMFYIQIEISNHLARKNESTRSKDKCRKNVK